MKNGAAKRFFSWRHDEITTKLTRGRFGKITNAPLFVVPSGGNKRAGGAEAQEEKVEPPVLLHVVWHSVQDREHQL